MTHLKLIYNPYKVKTELYFITNDVWEPIDSTSKFINIMNKPIFRWLYSDNNHQGFFDQLALFGDNEYEIDYYGLMEDFDELVYAADLFRKDVSFEAPQITLHYMSAYEQQMSNRPENKIKKLKELYQQSLSFPYVKESEIPELLHDAISDEIEIGAIALLSAGKSTLINAFLGRRILPTASEAKTAVISRIIIDPDQKHFTARCRRREGNWEEVPGTINREQIEILNDQVDSETGRSVCEVLEVCGPAFRSKIDCSPKFNQALPQIIFTDTPGINNAQNNQHKELTEQLLSKRNQNLLMFLFTAESFQTDDTKHMLESILNTFPDSNRLIFVCNRADEITMTYQEQYNQLLTLLRGYGISRPNLFLVCAKAAELARTYQYDSECEKEEDGDYFTVDENSKLDAYRKKFTSKTETGSGKFVKGSDVSSFDPALYHFSSLSNLAKSKFDEQAMKLQLDKSEEAELQMVLLNSGVPALEYFIANYIERQAVPIKLQHLSEVMMQKDVMDFVYKVVEEELEGYIEESKHLEHDLKEIDERIRYIDDEILRIANLIYELDTYFTSGKMLKEQLHRRIERAKQEYLEFYKSILTQCHPESKTLYHHTKFGTSRNEFGGISIYEVYACAQSCIYFLYKDINFICSDIKEMTEQGESFYREIWKYDNSERKEWYKKSDCYSTLTKDIEPLMRSYLQDQAGLKMIDTSISKEEIYSSLIWAKFRGASFHRIDKISHDGENSCIERGYKIFPPIFTRSEISSMGKDQYSLGPSFLGSVKVSYGSMRKMIKETSDEAGISTRPYKWISWDLVEFISLRCLDEEVHLILDGMPWDMCESASIELDKMFFESKDEFNNKHRRLIEEKNQLREKYDLLVERKEQIQAQIESLQKTLWQMSVFFKEINDLFEIKLHTGG